MSVARVYDAVSMRIAAVRVGAFAAVFVSVGVSAAGFLLVLFLLVLFVVF